MCRNLEFKGSKGNRIFYMLTDGLDRLGGLCSVLDETVADQKDIDLAMSICDEAEDLRKKYYYEPVHALFTTAGPLGAGLKDLEEGSEAEEAVYRTCKEIYGHMVRIESEVASRLAARYREEGFPPRSERTWVDNVTLEWTEAHSPGLLGERLELEGQKK
jgi:hypothetical protein